MSTKAIDLSIENTSEYQGFKEPQKSSHLSDPPQQRYSNLHVEEVQLCCIFFHVDIDWINLEKRLEKNKSL